MTTPHRPIHQPGRAGRAEREADLTVRIVLWIAGGLTALALALWWVLT